MKLVLDRRPFDEVPVLVPTARHVRRVVFAAVTGRPSAVHFGSPPSRITTSRAPISLKVHHTLGADDRPTLS